MSDIKSTLKDIAADTGFSLTTVSLVLNHKPCKIPDTTKAIIFESAKRLEYRPNRLAVSLVKKKSDTIAFVVSDIRNTFFASLAKGVEDACRAYGKTMILCNTDNQHEQDIRYINMLVDKGMDGIVYGMSGDTNLEKGRECCQLMENQGMPFVMVDRYFKELDYPCIKVDHVQGGYLAAKYLIEKGHRKIACASGPAFLDDAADRLRGVQKALEEAGIPFDPSLVYEGPYEMETGEQAFAYFQDKSYTAVFAFNDLIAYGFYTQARKAGKRIPEDFSLVGYDDIYFSAILETPLTTVHQPVYEMGKKAAKKLFHIIDAEPEEEQTIVLEPYLVERESVKKK